jgi:predicted protein tyrosine phosphatase
LHMNAFWWFKEKSIAGMARPGFNAVHWFDLPFDEAVLLGWLGQYSSGTVQLDSFRNHLQDYAPRIFKFYNLNEVSGAESLKIFRDSAGILEICGKLTKRTQIFDNFEIVDNDLNFTLSHSRLKTEIEFLKRQGIDRIISLTEKHHHKEVLQDHFTLHHLGIEDLGAPKMEQVLQLAEVIQSSIKNKETVAVHCLAGIGRTSTMLMASHIVMGERARDLELLLKKQNPTFILTGTQGEFLRSLSAQ